MENYRAFVRQRLLKITYLTASPAKIFSLTYHQSGKLVVKTGQNMDRPIKIGNSGFYFVEIRFCNMKSNEVKLMKELYLNAEMDVVKFTVADIITTSVDPGEGGGMGGENETEFAPIG